jgi:hypothetical protein
MGIEELGELIILHQLLQLSSERTRHILERQASSPIGTWIGRGSRRLPSNWMLRRTICDA